MTLSSTALLQVEIGHGLIKAGTPSAADVHNMLKENLLYDGTINVFSRKWRLLIVGHDHEYEHTALKMEVIALISIVVATLIISALILFIVLQNYQNSRRKETMISMFEVETQNLDVQVRMDRKKAEDELNNVAQSLRLLIDTANVPVFGIDKEGRVNEWNLKTAELMGYRCDEVTGRDLVQDFITPEYRSVVKEVFDNALKGLDTSSFEFPLFSKAGISIELLLNVNPRRNASGDIVGVVGFGQDMTAKRKAMQTEVDLSKAIPTKP